MSLYFEYDSIECASAPSEGKILSNIPIWNIRNLDVERFLLRTKEPVLIGIIFVMLAMYLGLGLALNSKLPFQIAYSLPSLPFIFIFVDIIFVRRMHD